MTDTIHCEVAVVGGSLGGVAAAHQASVQGQNVLLFSESAWPGGQITAQGVTPLDEHDHIERYGGTLSYHRFRQSVRQHYHRTYNAPLQMRESVIGPNMPLNPGNGWVSRLCFEPRAALRALPSDFAMWHGWRPVAAQAGGVTLTNNSGQRLHVQADYIIDATDLGDLLPLADVDYVTGAESRAQTGEPSAPDTPRPGEVQGITYSFAVEFCRGGNHTIPRPPGYAYFREHQPYTLRPTGRDGQPVVYRMFEVSEQGNLPFWTYRRIHDGALLGGNDISLINWVSNDYHGGSIIDVSPAERERQLTAAKRLSLGFLYWLQTECPRDDGGRGYPELKLRPDIMGTADGLSQQPYIRESRRIVPRTRITEQHIAATHQSGARAHAFRDSVGLGWYAMDLHPCVGNPSLSMYTRTKPFQIPLGALIPHAAPRLLAGCKNIGTTHLTNGAYRLQPTEWAIGEAAGMLAAFCRRHDVSPHDVHADDWLLWRFQHALVRRGVPIYWALDVPYYDDVGDLFVVTQLLLVRGVLVTGGRRWHQLTIEPDAPLGDDVDLDALQRIAADINTRAAHEQVNTSHIVQTLTWRNMCELFRPALYEAIQRNTSQE